MLQFSLSWACIGLADAVTTTEFIYAAVLLCPKDTVLPYTLSVLSSAIIPESLVEAMQYIHSILG